MSDDRYDELLKRKQSERDDQRNEAERERAAQQRIDQVAFHRRNALFAALSKRAEELEKRYPQLGQLFAKTYGDRFDLIKSQHPPGKFTFIFDAGQRQLAGEFSNSGVYLEYEMRPVFERETVELWSGGRAHSDEEIVQTVFDQFMEDIA